MFSKSLFAVLAALAVNAQTISTPVSSNQRMRPPKGSEADEAGRCHPVSYVYEGSGKKDLADIVEPARFTVSGGQAPYIV
jgi:hypothetical protein